MCLNHGGFALHYFEKYNYPFESVLIGIVKPNNIKSTLKPFLMDKFILSEEIKRVKLFTGQLTQKQKDVKK